MEVFVRYSSSKESEILTALLNLEGGNSLSQPVDGCSYGFAVALPLVVVQVQHAQVLQLTQRIFRQRDHHIVGEF